MNSPCAGPGAWIGQSQAQKQNSKKSVSVPVDLVVLKRG